jgi:mRNA interferase MazF
VSRARPLVRGDVILVPFPFTDLAGSKVRPALIVGRVYGQDVLAAFITSQSPGGDPQAELSLAAAHPEFKQTGLKTASVIHLDKIATLDRRLVQRRLGQIGPQTSILVAHALRYVLQL